MTHVISDGFGIPNPGEASILLYDIQSGKREIVFSGKHDDFTHTTGGHPHPQWSRNESRILFNSADCGRPQVLEVGVGLRD